MKRNARRWLIVVMACIFLSYDAATVMGFCYSQRRFLSDDELLLSAMKEEMRPGGEFPAEIRTTEDAVAYRAAHPDCCRIIRWALYPTSSFASWYDQALSEVLNVLFGGRPLEVWIRYPNSGGLYSLSMVVVSPCGQAFDWSSEESKTYYNTDFVHDVHQGAIYVFMIDVFEALSRFLFGTASVPAS